MVVRKLPKLETRVRFSYPAPVSRIVVRKLLWRLRREIDLPVRSFSVGGFPLSRSKNCMLDYIYGGSPLSELLGSIYSHRKGSGVL